MGPTMGIGMTKVLHVKIPVTDLHRSACWYAELMDLELTHEFIEGDELVGAALRSKEGAFSIALRLREHCAGAPDLVGFDVVALHMRSRDSLVELLARCRARGIDSTEVLDRGPHEAIVDIPDPDGTVLRFYWVEEDEEAATFRGMVFSQEGPPELLSEPRLRGLAVAGRSQK